MPVAVATCFLEATAQKTKSDQNSLEHGSKDKFKR